jgi:endonuclease-3
MQLIKLKRMNLENIYTLNNIIEKKKLDLKDCNKIKVQIDIEKKKIVAKKLIEYGKNYLTNMQEDKSRVNELQTTLTGDKIKINENEEINPKESPFEFLLSVIFDQKIDADRAWKAPQELRKRLGHLDVEKIANMNEEELSKIIKKSPALHIYFNKMAKWIINAAKLLLVKYNGKAENIWANKPSAKELEKRFREFSGISQKKASMAVNILVRDYDIPISGSKEGIDISYDRHIRRVFLRAGLVEKDEENEIIETARKLNTHYPGELDFPAWKIGRNFCHPKNPNCNNCPLGEICPKLLNVKVPID